MDAKRRGNRSCSYLDRTAYPFLRLPIEARGTGMHYRLRLPSKLIGGRSGDGQPLAPRRSPLAARRSPLSHYPFSVPMSTRMLRHFPWLNRSTLRTERVTWPVRIANQMWMGCRVLVSRMTKQMLSGTTTCETIEM